MARPRSWSAPIAFVAACLLGAAGGCGAGSGTGPTGAIPGQLLREARPIGSGMRFRPPAAGPVAGACRRRLGPRFGVHLEVFAANRVVIIPAGIGTRRPRRMAAGRISAARCFGSLVTLDPTGVVLLRPGPPMTLSDFFRAWGQPLSLRRLASFRSPAAGRVAVFVDGRRWRGAPGSVPLRRHAEIVAEVGAYIPPHPAYRFPPGA